MRLNMLLLSVSCLICTGCSGCGSKAPVEAKDDQVSSVPPSMSLQDRQSQEGLQRIAAGPQGVSTGLQILASVKKVSVNFIGLDDTLRGRSLSADERVEDDLYWKFRLKLEEKVKARLRAAKIKVWGMEDIKAPLVEYMLTPKLQLEGDVMKLKDGSFVHRWELILNEHATLSGDNPLLMGYCRVPTGYRVVGISHNEQSMLASLEQYIDDSTDYFIQSWTDANSEEFNRVFKEK